MFCSGLSFAQTATPPNEPDKKNKIPTEPVDEELIVLSPFEVDGSSSKGYLATQTLAGSRINTKLEDVGSAVSVVTSQFLKDVGATDNKSLLAYTTNTEVGGTLGNFIGASGGQSEDESGRFKTPNQNIRVRGLAAADNTRNFFASDIPWDAYNVDRIDFQRGANSILFGLGSPVGIINATTKTAQHRTFGELDLGYGSYGSTRVALDSNINILKNELSMRIDVLRNDQHYRQDPAYSLDRRAFGTLRYDPKFLNRNDAKTSLKVSFEGGKVDSNNPRTITPIDCITGWWDHLGKTVYNPNTVQYTGNWYDTSGNITAHKPNTGQYSKSFSDGTLNPYYQAWLGAPSMYGGVWMQVNNGQNVPYSISMPETKTPRGISSTGAIDSTIGGLPFSRRVTVATSAYWAEREANAPYQKWGLWKAGTLTDPSIFDFYNNLLDGDNKKEWQKFNNFNVSLTQSFFNEKLAFEAAYDKQHYKNGQYSFAGGGTLYVDINSYNLDGTPNPNVGKAYTESSYTYGNNSSDSIREASHLSGVFNHDFAKGHSDNWLLKALGRHVLSGLLSRDSYVTDNRSFKRYGTTDQFGNLVATGSAATAMNGNDRVVTSTVYLSDSLLNRDTYRGANIGRPTGVVQVPGTADFRYFDSTWTATGVDPAATWVSTYSGQPLTQSENPANYRGWTTTPVKILSAENGDQDALTFGATLAKRKVQSKAIVLQSYFWDDMIVGMYGLRNDKVKSWAYDATLVNDRADFSAISTKASDNGRRQYEVADKPYSLTEETMPTWSLVGKLDRILPKSFPVKISLFYDKSRNFQVTGARNNVFGNPLSAPTGQTIERGIMLATKDDRFVLRINHYDTNVINATNTTGFPTWFLLGDFIKRNEDRADAYEYHLAELGNPASANQTGGSWEWRYAPRPGETQAQADALAASAVAGWRAYTQEPLVKKILSVWGFNDFTGIQPTTESTPVANFTPTEDQRTVGWEYEFTANPTPNWRISINASETKASRSNIGGKELQAFVDLTTTYQNGPMGDIRQWGGTNTTSTSRVSWNSNFYSKYLLDKLQEGTFSSELRKWHYNVVTSYDFTRGFMKGVSVGMGYRWQDKVAIGYPVIDPDGTGNSITYDLKHPYYGPSEDAIDLWFGYERKLTSKLAWRIQLNIRNVGDHNKLVPLSTQWDGSVAAWGIAPSQEWTLTNTFKF